MQILNAEMILMQTMMVLPVKNLVIVLKPVLQLQLVVVRVTISHHVKQTHAANGL